MSSTSPIRKRRPSFEFEPRCCTLTDDDFRLLNIYITLVDLSVKMGDDNYKVFKTYLHSEYTYHPTEEVEDFIHCLINVLDYASLGKIDVHQAVQDLLDVVNLSQDVLETIGVEAEAYIWQQRLV